MHHCTPTSSVSNLSPTESTDRVAGIDIPDADSSDDLELAYPPIDEVPTLLDLLDAARKADHAQLYADKGYERNEQDCPECEIGELWSKHHETVCDACSVVFDEEERRRNEPDQNPWERYWENRDAYQNGTLRCPGGYPHVYDWETSDDLEDQRVIDLDPQDFYR